MIRRISSALVVPALLLLAPAFVWAQEPFKLFVQESNRISTDPRRVVEEDVGGPVGLLTLRLVHVLEEGEKGLAIDDVRDRAHKHGLLLGELHALRFVLRAEAPKSWEGFHLVFPGTVVREGKKRLLLVLERRNGAWELTWIDRAFPYDKRCRVVIADPDPSS